MSLVEVIMPMSISILTIRCRTEERRNESIWSTVLSRCIWKWRHLVWSLGRGVTGISKLLIDNIRWLIHKEKAVCGRKRTRSLCDHDRSLLWLLWSSSLSLMMSPCRQLPLKMGSNETTSIDRHAAAGSKRNVSPFNTIQMWKAQKKIVKIRKRKNCQLIVPLVRLLLFTFIWCVCRDAVAWWMRSK